MDSILLKKTDALPNVNDVEPYNESDHELMAELKAVLTKHNALKRFGVMLLHDHFPIAEDEIMVEYEDLKNRTLTTMPVKAAELVGKDINLFETQWRLDTMDALAVCRRFCPKNGSDHSGHPVHSQ